MGKFYTSRKTANEYSRFSGTGRGDWAPDHGGAHYRINTGFGVIDVLDSSLALTKRGKIRGLDNLKNLTGYNLFKK